MVSQTSDRQISVVSHYISLSHVNWSLVPLLPHFSGRVSSQHFSSLLFLPTEKAGQPEEFGPVQLWSDKPERLQRERVQAAAPAHLPGWLWHGGQGSLRLWWRGGRRRCRRWWRWRYEVVLSRLCCSKNKNRYFLVVKSNEQTINEVLSLCWNAPLLFKNN